MLDEDARSCFSCCRTMEKMSFSLICVAFFCLIFSCNGIESPQFTILHSESDFEIRLYRESSWMSAPVTGISFEKATKEGFHRLFQYIQGANLNSSRIRMTAPVLTSIVPGEGPLGSSAFFVQFYLPVKFQAVPPLPLPELNLQSDAWGSRCIAVRKFSGFARDSNVVEEAEKLDVSLSRSPWANSTTSDSKYAYSIAQYNSPFRVIGRVNEIWVKVDGSELDGCGSSGVATY
ncbi:heme-binding protein 2-like [Macadamia integrifolia]|uniref:heme-binding protein 2-like n=1 Tax=Macadamia integrifolia TaxID=60698 RepID=UPI001C4E5483|nr:heme-binding protein 2-like [Macadamia integrifolia]